MSNDKKTIKEMRANDMTPAFPTHPGEVLKDEIEYRGISQRQLAEEMGIAYSALNEILNARRPVTEKTALLFEAALGVNAEPCKKAEVMNSDNIDFVTYCIGNLSRRLGLNARDVYQRLKTSGILTDYIVPSYDVLHTFSKEYLMEDLIDFMKEKGVL